MVGGSLRQRIHGGARAGENLGRDRPGLSKDPGGERSRVGRKTWLEQRRGFGWLLSQASRGSRQPEGIEVADDRIALNISRCRAGEAFQCLGAPEICQQYCESDHAFIRAFNPLMSLVRTKLLSKGADHCDHQWVLNQ
ncbi:MAG: hypothetical protein FJW26_07195 [Acidimicrobiia bacterium]|nr:hypothetical protein [Acidimicrobiia bacterium]